MEERAKMKHCECPPRCFCQYDVQELREIGYKKMVQGIPTVELVKNAKSVREKELISVVSMFDLDDTVSEIMIREKMSGETCNVLACREILKRRLLRKLEKDMDRRADGV
jgi:hypothetical protein